MEKRDVCHGCSRAQGGSSWLCGQGNRSEWEWTSPLRVLHHELAWEVLQRAWRKCHSVVKQDSHPITSHPLAPACFQAGQPVPALPNHTLFMLHQTPSPLPWSKDHLQSMVHLHSQCSLEAGALPGGRALKTTPKLEHFQLHNFS